MKSHDTNDALPSGRFVLRISPEQHAALRSAAAACELSLNEYCTRKLAAPVVSVTGPAAASVEKAVAVAGDALMGVVAFGSWARGAMRESSDVDLLIVLEDETPIRRSLYRTWDASPLFWRSHRVEPHLVHLPERHGRTSGLWAEAAVDGVVLFERDLEVSRCLVDIRREIVAGRILRRESHGQPYLVEAAWMRKLGLARDYIERAGVRLKALDVLFEAESWADVVRESQEVVELGLRALLRSIGVDPPRVHDVSDVLLQERERLPEKLLDDLDELVEASRHLRRDRELAFYGAEDLTPSDFYSREDAERARAGARGVVAAVEPHVAPR